MLTPQRSIKYTLVNSHLCQEVAAEIIVETPVSLTVNGVLWLTFMCTPVDLEAMMIGFLFNEGLINSAAEVIEARLCPSGDNVDVWLTHSVKQPPAWRRTSGCTGGVTAVEETALPAPSRPLDGSLNPQQIYHLIESLFEVQDLYRTSGGVHTSALSDGQSIVLMAEDIGRHNTLDKLAGKLLQQPLQLENRVLLTTGRISSEMMQKAVRMGASTVISRTSPSSLSIQIAQREGVTLIGYARRNNFRIYTHPERVLCEALEYNISA